MHRDRLRKEEWAYSAAGLGRIHPHKGLVLVHVYVHALLHSLNLQSERYQPIFGCNIRLRAFSAFFFSFLLAYSVAAMPPPIAARAGVAMSLDWLL